MTASGLGGLIAVYLSLMFCGCWRLLWQSVFCLISCDEATVRCCYGLTENEPEWAWNALYTSCWLLFAINDMPTYGMSLFMGGRVWDNVKKKRSETERFPILLQVPPQGLEPWTPTLRVSCSTNWAKEASLFLIASANLRHLFHLCKFFEEFFCFFLPLPIP